MTKDEIVKKLEEREAQKAFVERCLKVSMCPYCGKDLEEISHGEEDFYTLKCEPCDRVWGKP